MIGNLQALVRRELWEHRSIFVTPVAIAVVLSLLTVLAFVSAAAFGSHVDLAVLTASNVGELEKRAVLMGFLSMPTTIFAIGAWILIVFYSLDMLLPIIRLREEHYNFDLTGGAAYYFYGHKMMGYVLATFLIAGITGLV